MPYEVPIAHPGELSQARHHVAALERATDIIVRWATGPQRDTSTLPDWPALSRDDQEHFGLELGETLELSQSGFDFWIVRDHLPVQTRDDLASSLEHYGEFTPFSPNERTLLYEFLTEEYWNDPAAWAERVATTRANEAYGHWFRGVFHRVVHGVDLHDRWWDWRRGRDPYAGAHAQSQQVLRDLGRLLTGREMTG